MAEFDIKKLFDLVFNFQALPYPMLLLPDGRLSKLPSYDDIYIPPRKQFSDLGERFYDYNNLGIEVFMPIRLKDEISGKEILLQNTIMTVSLRKTIVETSLVNRQGSVHEAISVDDWDINIRGIIANNGNDYPDGDVKDLKDMVVIGAALEIKNAVTAICLLENEKVIIRSFRLLDNRGVQNVQAFEIECVSDMKFDLVII